MPLAKLISVFGLLLDITGSGFLSYGLVSKTLDQIRREAPQFTLAINKAYVESELSQKIEAVFGFIFLLFGFLFQVTSYFVSTTISGISQFKAVILCFMGYILLTFFSIIVCRQIKKKKYQH